VREARCILAGLEQRGGWACGVHGGALETVGLGSRAFGRRVFSACFGLSISLWAAAALATAGLAAEPVPPQKRIPAEVVRTLRGPADMPMYMPTDVAVDRTGRVFVADGVNDRIVCFTAAGRFDTSITHVGGERLNRPVGLAVDAADRLWIADSANHRVLVVTAASERLETIDLPAPEDGRASDPTDLAVTPDGRRTYIVDNDNHRLVVWDNRRKRLISAGEFGSALGRFRWPFMICLGPEGFVYVSEAIGACVRRINPEDGRGGWVSGWGVELGRFYRPKGVATDARGRLYVSDSTLGVVQVFEPSGALAGILTGAGGEPLRFEHPMGMSFGPQGRLYVVELGANRVAVVSIHPDSPARAVPPVDPISKGDRK